MTAWPQGGNHSPSHPWRCWCETQADKGGVIIAPQSLLPLAAIPSTKVGSSMANAGVAVSREGALKHTDFALFGSFFSHLLWFLQEVITL